MDTVISKLIDYLQKYWYKPIGGLITVLLTTIIALLLIVGIPIEKINKLQLILIYQIIHYIK